MKDWLHRMKELQPALMPRWSRSMPDRSLTTVGPVSWMMPAGYQFLAIQGWGVLREELVEPMHCQLEVVSAAKKPKSFSFSSPLNN
jgi:hypothetical protein